MFSILVAASRCGFGLLMYGFGSKKALVEDFASASLTDYSVVVINGYLPSVNLKQVLFCQFGCSNFFSCAALCSSGWKRSSFK